MKSETRPKVLTLGSHSYVVNWRNTGVSKAEQVISVRPARTSATNMARHTQL